MAKEDPYIGDVLERTHVIEEPRDEGAPPEPITSDPRPRASRSTHSRITDAAARIPRVGCAGRAAGVCVVAAVSLHRSVGGFVAVLLPFALPALPSRSNLTVTLPPSFRPLVWGPAQLQCQRPNELWPTDIIEHPTRET